MKNIYLVDVDIKTTKHGERLFHNIVGINGYESLKIHTEHYIDQVIEFHKEEFNKKKRKSLVTKLRIIMEDR